MRLLCPFKNALIVIGSGLVMVIVIDCHCQRPFHVVHMRLLCPFLSASALCFPGTPARHCLPCSSPRLCPALSQFRCTLRLYPGLHFQSPSFPFWHLLSHRTSARAPYALCYSPRDALSQIRGALRLYPGLHFRSPRCPFCRLLSHRTSVPSAFCRPPRLSPCLCAGPSSRPSRPPSSPRASPPPRPPPRRAR